MVFIPRFERFKDKKPSGVLRANLDSPFLNDDSVLFVNHCLIDLISGKSATINQPVNEYLDDYELGECVHFTGKTEAGHLISKRYTSNTQVTFITEFTWESGANNSFPAIIATTTNNKGFRLNSNQSLGGNIGLTKGGKVALPVVNVTADVPYRVVATHDTVSGDYRIYAKNMLDLSVATASSNNTVTALSSNGTIPLGIARTDIADKSWNGQIGFGAILNSYCSVDGCIELLENPYQLLRPRRTFFVFGAGTSGITLLMNNALHNQLADNTALTQANVLATNEATQAVNTDSPLLAQANVLTANDAIHSHITNNITLSSALDLVVNESAQTLSSDNLELLQQSTLNVSESTHANTVDNVTLQAGLSLSVAEVSQSVTVDNLILTQQNVLTLAEATQAISTDNITLAQASVLAVSSILHSETVDTIALDFSVVIAVDNTNKTQSVDHLALTQAQLLAIASVEHAVTAAGIDLTQHSTLIVSDSLHAQLTANINLLDGAIPLSTNAGTVFMLAGTGNVFVVHSESNIFMET